MRSLRGVLLATVAVLAGVLALALPASQAGLFDPETTIESGPSGLINTADVTFTFSTDFGTGFECDMDGGGFGACTSPADYFSLSQGSHTFQVRAIDDSPPLRSTDQTPASRTFTVDTVAPTTTIDSGPSGTTGATDAHFTFSSNDGNATFECELDGGNWGSCSSSSSQDYTGLSSGSHTFSVRATDQAGNTDPSVASRTWTVDTAPPTTSINSGPSGTTNSTSASFTYSSTKSGSTFQCRLDIGAWESCPASGKTYTGLGEGSHTFYVYAIDSVGNADPNPVQRTWTIDTSPPETSIISGPSGTVTSASATFGFSSSEASSSFECQLDNGSWADCGSTSSKTYNNLSDGQHTFRVRATDPAGNTDPTEATRTWNVDAAPPVTSIDTGPSGTVNSSSATFTFSSNEAGSFECRLDGPTWGSCTSPAQYTLGDGSHTFSVRAIDQAGNTDPTPPTRTWTIDTSPPDTSIDSGPSGTVTTNSATFTFSSTEAGSSLACQLDGGAWSSCSSPNTYNSLSDGQHTFNVRATDGAGNTDQSPASRSWTVDATPPTTTINSGPSALSSSAGANFTFSSSEAGSTFQCNLDNAGWAACTSPKSYGSLGQGSHTFQVRATDSSGNTDPSAASFTWTIDLAAPDTTINSGPGSISGSSSATFSFSSSEAGSSFQCNLDNAGWQACASPKTYTNVVDGGHTFAVRATDPAGNTDQSEATYNWTVLTTSPETVLDPPVPSGLTADNTPTFNFHSDDATASFQCRLDGPGGATGSYSACSNPKTYAALGDDSYTFYVRAVNAVGNSDSSPATTSFTVDNAAPDTTVATGPQGAINVDSASFTFTSTEAGSSFVCKLEPEESAFAPCTSPQGYTALAEGGHTFRVAAVDQVGHVDPSPAFRSFTVDTTPPDTTITAGPSGTTADDTPTFEFSGTGGATAFECRFDSEAFAACTSPYTRTAGLTNGPHTFEVRAKDAVGNLDPSPASRSITVNTVGPSTSITLGPSDPTNDATPTFAFTSDDSSATFACELTGPGQTAGFTSCTSPKTYPTLGAGSYTFSVRATAGGITDATPASQTFTVDVTAPQTTIDSGPSGTVAFNIASFTFSANEAGSTFQCKLDTGAFAPCSSPVNYGGLADGPHTFTVKATDLAGNVDATEASRTWTVDTSLPDTIINSGPSGPTNSAAPTFTFGSEPGATFQCRLDGPGATQGAYSACNTGSKGYSGLAQGTYTFYVYATDSGGSADPTPAARSFTVDTAAPVTTLDPSGPNGTVKVNTASFIFSSNEVGSTFECKLDAQAFAACTSPANYGALIDGQHTFRVRAKDAAGNVDASEATRTWTIDSTVPDTLIPSPPQPFFRIGSPDPTIAFSSTEQGTTFQCKLERAGAAPPPPVLAPCTSPTTYSNLVDGAYTFTVVATDSAQNVDPSPATATFIVDKTRPQTTIQTTLGSTSNLPTADFTLSSNEVGVTFECRLDRPGQTGAFAPCSSPVSYQGLTANGTYTFRARATDPAGNLDTSEATFTWVIDTNLPDTTINSSPSNPNNSTSGTFTISSNKPGAVFSCQLDGAPWPTAGVTCQSPVNVTGLSEGQHTFSVTASDSAGADPQPATRTWKVDLTPPETAIHSGPSGATTSSSATFSFSSSETGSSYQCRLDGGEWSSCPSPKVYADIQLGGHTFEARAIDAAANVDPSPAKRSWSVNAPPVTPAAASGPQLLAPFPVVRIAGKLAKRGILLRLFQVSVRDGMKVVIRCAPRKICPFGRQSRTAARGPIQYEAHASKFIRIRRLEGRLLPAGIRLEVFITKPGMIGKYTRFKVRKGKPPKRVDRCLPPNSSKPIACPS